MLIVRKIESARGLLVKPGNDEWTGALLFDLKVT